MKEEWVVIATSDTVVRAQLAVTHLRAEGVEARIEHEHFSTLFPGVGGPSTGIQIKVHWQQARKAYELLETYQEGNSGLWL